MIDKISVRLDASKDKYWAELSNLNIRDANIDDRIVTEHEKMMMGGIWAIVDITYDSTMAIGSKLYPFVVSKVRPIQLSNFDMSRISNNRKNFTNEEWLNVLLRSGGYEPESEGMTQRMKMLLLSRFIPMVEANLIWLNLAREVPVNHTCSRSCRHTPCWFREDKVRQPLFCE